MKEYFFGNRTFDELPGLLVLEDGTTVSPVTEATFKAHGGVIEDDGTCWSREELEFQALPCCTAFKAVCGQIAAFLGAGEFLGGYDDILAFQQSEAAQANPVRALQLAMMWQGADDDCNYRARKLGIGRPRWWYCCWDIDPDAAAEVSSS